MKNANTIKCDVCPQIVPVDYSKQRDTTMKIGKRGLMSFNSLNINVHFKDLSEQFVKHMHMLC